MCVVCVCCVRCICMYGVYVGIYVCRVCVVWCVYMYIVWCMCRLYVLCVYLWCVYVVYVWHVCICTCDVYMCGTCLCVLCVVWCGVCISVCDVCVVCIYEWVEDSDCLLDFCSIFYCGSYIEVRCFYLRHTWLPFVPRKTQSIYPEIKVETINGRYTGSPLIS